MKTILDEYGDGILAALASGAMIVFLRSLLLSDKGPLAEFLNRCLSRIYQ